SDHGQGVESAGAAQIEQARAGNRRPGRIGIQGIPSRTPPQYDCSPTDPDCKTGERALVAKSAAVPGDDSETSCRSSSDRRRERSPPSTADPGAPNGGEQNW